MDGRDTKLYIQQSIIIQKSHVKFQPDWFETFREKAKKVKKIAYIMHKLSLIMHTTYTIFID